MSLLPRNTYGLIGWPIAHSLSPELFRSSALAQQGHIYQLFPMADLQSLEALLLAYRPRGLNVTSPYKEEVLRALPHLHRSEEVLALGATNVLVLDYEDLGGRTLVKGRAYNTDVAGFIAGLRPHLLGHERQAIILGTGGAARAAHYALHLLGIRAAFASRSPRSEVQTPYWGGETALVYGYEEVSNILPQCDLIVQATPLGRIAAVAPPLDYANLRPHVLGYELNYGQGKTPFMQEILAHGGRAIDGLEMLRGQAEEAYRLWSLHQD